MAPGVMGKEMTLVDDPTYSVLVGWLIDAGEVLTIHEEGGLDAVIAE